MYGSNENVNRRLRAEKITSIDAVKIVKRDIDSELKFNSALLQLIVFKS